MPHGVLIGGGRSPVHAVGEVLERHGAVGRAGTPTPGTIEPGGTWAVRGIGSGRHVQGMAEGVRRALGEAVMMSL